MNNTTFIIKHVSTLENLKVLLDYFLNFLEVKVIVISNTIPITITAENLEVIFVENCSNSKLVNLALQKINTPIVALCNNSLINKQVYLEAENKILNREADIIYPYNKIYITEEKVDYKNLETGVLQEGNLYKYCIFLNTEIYKKNGGENEELLGDRYGDDERYLRFKKLGYNIIRLDNKLLYLGNMYSESRFLGDYKTTDRDLYIKLEQMDSQKYKFYSLFYGKPYHPSYEYNNYVIPHLVGGLGNRLFQIASIYGVAKKKGKKFAISINYKDNNIHSNINYYDTIFKDIPKVGTLQAKIHVESIEKYSTYTDINLEEGNYVMHGYYQNEKYFKDYKQDILKLFNFDFIENQYKNLYNSMFIHLRYFPPEDGGSLHNIDLGKYLEKVCFNLGDLCNTAHFFIVSNDLGAMVRRYDLSKFKNKTLVTNLDELQTLNLMRQCWKGGICSNSSLSFWGSYLNQNKDKKIYFPGKYIKNDWLCDIFTSEMIVVPV